MTVAAFLVEALAAGGAAVAPVTPGRRAAIERRMAEAGVDVAAAARGRDLVVCDAARTLAAVTTGGGVDPDAFRREVAAVVREMASGGRVTHVYDEMVDLLWRDGRVLAVLALESLWHEVADSTGISVLCGYTTGVTGGAGDDARQPHEPDGAATGPGAPASPVVAPEVEASATFGALPEAPRAARRWVVDALRFWPSGTGGLLDDAALVVTELATNAVRHARSAFTVRVEAARGVVRIVVEDAGGGAQLVVARRASALSTSGRGLRIVDALVSRWGVAPVPGGTLVWAELAVADR